MDNVLPPGVAPTVIVMNPPFSASAGRVQGQRDTAIGARHIEQALKRLQDNGRLVAIVGQGMALDRPAFKEWWKDIEEKYNVRANIGISGKEYAKYGTTFDNQILVIDKTGATTQPVLTGKVESVADLPGLLEGIKNERQRIQRSVDKPAVERILKQYQIPFNPSTELASLALIREALERGLLSTGELQEPLLLIAKLSANPELAMSLMTESELGEEKFEIELSETLEAAAAEILEEIVAGIKARTLEPLQ